MRPSRGTFQAFTLVELLAVIAVIGILLALLLPALQRAKSRALAVVCLCQLRQGPAALSGNSSSKVRFCPTDQEPRAGVNLATLDESYNSYFASHNARLDQPQSIAAGDRNVLLVPVSAANSPIRLAGEVRLFRTNSFVWGPDLHQRKGNLILADGSAATTGIRKLNEQVGAHYELAFDWFVPHGPAGPAPAP